MSVVLSWLLLLQDLEDIRAETAELVITLEKKRDDDVNMHRRLMRLNRTYVSPA